MWTRRGLLTTGGVAALLGTTGTALSGAVDVSGPPDFTFVSMPDFLNADVADLSGLPQALMFCGTRDLLVPGCRLLARRAEEAGWDLSYVEEPDLIHVYPLVSFIPEARRAWRATREFLG